MDFADGAYKPRVSMRYEPIVQGKARMRKAPSSKIQTIVPGKYVMIYKPNAKN